jgi:hypothetical protein
MNVDTIIFFATKYLGGVMVTSAKLCLEDAAYLNSIGDTTAAKHRALKSLAYSVGIAHPVYRAAVA